MSIFGLTNAGIQIAPSPIENVDIQKLHKLFEEKYPSNIKEYMLVDDVAEKVISNLKSDTPELDQIIKRPIK